MRRAIIEYWKGLNTRQKIEEVAGVVGLLALGYGAYKFLWFAYYAGFRM